MQRPLVFPATRLGRGRYFLHGPGYERDDPELQGLRVGNPRGILWSFRESSGSGSHGDSTKGQRDTRGADAGAVPTGADFPRLTVKRYVDRAAYSQAFAVVQSHQRAGNSYLTNLTFPTGVELSTDLRTCFFAVSAPYRIYVPGRFLCFSPETFVTIDRGVIRSYPMKGTIDASIPNARRRLLEDEKESAEHITIVDLIRNDLGRVARRVWVERFRYLDRIESRGRPLLQMSSEIAGELPDDWRANLGTVLSELLPAGSITGAPKRKTCRIIEEAETEERGYYTGVAGFFDGDRVDSCVLIRFLEQGSHGIRYRSGGGVTIYSDEEAEYQELCHKIYLPVGWSSAGDSDGSQAEPSERSQDSAAAQRADG